MYVFHSGFETSEFHSPMDLNEAITLNIITGNNDSEEGYDTDFGDDQYEDEQGNYCTFQKNLLM